MCMEQGCGHGYGAGLRPWLWSRTGAIGMKKTVVMGIEQDY